MLVNIGVGFGVFGIVSIIICASLLIPRLSVYAPETRTPTQIQLDTLITDIIAYEKSVPPSPSLPVYTNDSAEREKLSKEYNQQLKDYYYQRNRDFFGEFSATTANITTKLHDLNIITDEEYQDMQAYSNSTLFMSISPIFLQHLQKYKNRLDNTVNALNTK